MPKRLVAIIGPLLIAAMALLYAMLSDVSVPADVLNAQTETATTTTYASTKTTTTTDVGLPAEQSGSTTVALVEANALVIRVVDGDTLEARLDSEPATEYKIRLLGVNTPETVDPRRAVQCYGKQASDFTKNTLNGKRVRLDADPKADERDKYGRLLRNVILEDGTDFNALLIREGYANAYLSFPLNAARKVELRKLEAEAKAAKRGLWGVEGCSD